MKILSTLLILSMFFGSFAQIPLRLPSIISNHAVMLQSSDVKLWGWGPGSLKVAIVCSWSRGDTLFAPIGGDCSWEVTIKTPKAGGSNNIEFWCNNKLTKVEDILMGEVWLCSGQSNMELETNVGITDAPDVYKDCYSNEIRFFEVKRAFDKFPKSECEGEWKICDSTNLSSFSAVAYCFGRKLNNSLNVPVGLIGSYWGGTNVGSWCSEETVARDPALVKNIREGVTYAPQSNSVLYNGMIVPLAPYKLAGVIWYQGESNVSPTPETYSTSFSNMIQNWRELFETNLPFYFVQIAPWTGYGPGINSACLREQQEATLKVPKTGMITIGDLVVNDVTDIHPRAKAGVGNRLANLALKEIYNKNEIQPYQPGFKEVSFSKNKATVRVNSIDKLKCNSKEIISFKIAGIDKKFYDATAKIEKDGTITVFSSEVTNPVAVRYCFTSNQLPNLFDVNDLPLRPFRTDNWELISK
jgi:sialate O-acetylesterase